MKKISLILGISTIFILPILSFSSCSTSSDEKKVIDLSVKSTITQKIINETIERLNNSISSLIKIDALIKVFDGEINFDIFQNFTITKADGEPGVIEITANKDYIFPNNQKTLTAKVTELKITPKEKLNQEILENAINVLNDSASNINQKIDALKTTFDGEINLNTFGLFSIFANLENEESFARIILLANSGFVFSTDEKKIMVFLVKEEVKITVKEKLSTEYLTKVIYEYDAATNDNERIVILNKVFSSLNNGEIDLLTFKKINVTTNINKTTIVLSLKSEDLIFSNGEKIIVALVSAKEIKICAATGTQKNVDSFVEALKNPSEDPYLLYSIAQHLFTSSNGWGVMTQEEFDNLIPSYLSGPPQVAILVVKDGFIFPDHKSEIRSQVVSV